MGLIFCDGFDHYTTLSQKYDTVSGSPSISSSGVRTGTNGLVLSSFTSVQKDFTVTYYTLTVGVAMRFPSSFTSSCQLISFRKSGNSQVVLTYNNGRLGVETANVNRGDCPGYMSSDNVWHYVEMQAICPTTPTTLAQVADVKVRFDGDLIFDMSTLPLHTSTVYGFNQVVLLSSSSATIHMDDFYILDGTAPNDDFLGECRIETLFPTGAGTNTNWTPSTGSNYACVDENPPNSDTDYVSSSVVNTTDTYAFGNLTTSGITGVKAVQTSAFAKSVSTPVRVLNGVVLSGATTAAGTLDNITTTSYKFLETSHDVNPDTSTVWTETTVNAAEFGVKVRS